MTTKGGSVQKRWVEGEVLDDSAPGPRDAEDLPPAPGWIERNRGFIEQGKTLAQTALVVAPPPARLALAALSVAADGVLLAEDVRSGKIDRTAARYRAGGMAVEALALLAASRLAPAILARNRHRLRTAQALVRRMEKAAMKMT